MAAPVVEDEGPIFEACAVCADMGPVAYRVRGHALCGPCARFVVGLTMFFEVLRVPDLTKEKASEQETR